VNCSFTTKRSSTSPAPGGFGHDLLFEVAHHQDHLGHAQGRKGLQIATEKGFPADLHEAFWGGLGVRLEPPADAGDQDDGTHADSLKARSSTGRADR
jgi:hypothetical protein